MVTLEALLERLAQDLETSEPILISDLISDFSPELLVANSGHHNFSVISSSDGPVSRVFQGSDRRDLSQQTGAFGWHKDGLYHTRLPQLVLLYCEDAGRGDSDTRLADCAQAWDLLDPAVREDWHQLELVYIGRDGQRFPRPLVEPHSRTGQQLINASQRALVRPAPPAIGANRREVLDEIGEKLDLTRVHSQRWEAGAILVFDNERFAHARVASAPDLQRKLVRIWLSPERQTS